MAFILFLTAASFDALEFWKQAVALMCTCGKGFYSPPDASGEHSVEVHLEMMSEFIRVLRRQLEHVPADFFRDELAKANFLGPSLAALLQLGEMAVADLATQGRQDAQGRLKANVALFERRLRRLKALLAQRFELAADDLDADLLAQHEDAPVVVDVTSSACDDTGDDGMQLPEDHSTEVAASSAAAGMPAAVSRMSWMLEPPS